MLDADQLKAALVSLPAWSGDTSRISREVLADPAATTALRIQVAALAEDAEHHPEIQEVNGGTRFVLWTHSAGGVTAKDTSLAARIDAIVTSQGL